MSNSNKIIINGIVYKSKTDMCRKLGLNLSHINHCILRLGMEIKDAIKAPRVGRGHILNPNSKKRIISIIIDGIKYSSICEASRKLGIPFSNLRRAVSAGKNLSEYIRNRRKFIDEHTRNNIIKNNIPFDVYYTRIHRGWTKERASTQEVLPPGIHDARTNEDKSQMIKKLIFG